MGAKYRWSIKISRFSTNKSLYLANDTRYRHSYYGRRIGTRTRSIEWCHFQWPWTNLTLFSRSHHSDAKYLTNGYINGLSYKANRKPHPSFRMAPISKTLSDLWPSFQGHNIIQRQITRKWYNLQWRTDRKLHGLSNGAIFNDLERPLTWFLRSRHSLTLNISQTAIRPQ